MTTARREREGWGAPARRERGVMTPIVAGVCLVLGALAVGGASVGRMVAARQDAQRAADAALLAAAEVIRREGLPFDGARRTLAETVARANSALDLAFVWTVVETADRVDLACTARLGVSAPLLRDGLVTVAASAKASVPQRRFDEASRLTPKLVLVLDYSGSMDVAMRGSDQRSIDVLEASVRTLLDLGLRIAYGAVFFSTDVFGEVTLGERAPQQIRTAMERHDVGQSTATWKALDRVLPLVEAAEGEGKPYLLLVSDGRPQAPRVSAKDGMARAREAARRIWDAGITIWSLHIDNSSRSEGESLHDFMVSVSGAPDERRSEAYYRRASTPEALREQFEAIGGAIACVIGPLVPAPADPASLRVFLETGAGEVRVRSLVEAGGAARRDLGADEYEDQELYWYEVAEQTLYVTERVCDAVTEQGLAVVVRHARGTLTD